MAPKAPAENGREERIAQINARQAIYIALITAVAGIVGALIQGYFSSGKIQGLTEQLKSSDSKVEDLKGELAGPSASVVERDALYRLTADRLEGDLELTAGKGGGGQGAELAPTELQYRVLRRAIFLNLDVLRANPTILENTLETLVARGRPWVENQRARIVAEFPAIKSARLRWLQDVAIPELQRARSAAGQMSQSVPSAKVALPPEVWILDAAAGEEPTVTVTSLSVLNDEVALLKSVL
jgi:hypothetical protein